MKYIVEFEDEPCMYEDDVHFYKCIQAPWWGLSEKVIKQLTPYQPEPDCVSRKTALDAFGLSEKTRKYGGDHSGYDTRMLYEIQDTLESLPAVQPDHNADISEINKFIDGLEEIFADIRERHVDDSVCGLCEYDGAYMGQSGDWCNECPGFDKDDCFKLSDETRKKWIEEIVNTYPDHTADIGKKVSISCGQENDLISRQAAIDALARMMPRSYTPDGSHPADEEIFRAQEVFADCIEALEILPSAQPATSCSEIPNGSDDTISRQAAIDALDEQIEQCNKALGSFDISPKDEYAIKVEKASLKAYKEQLENMPSAQPTLCGYNIEHLILIANVLRKENLPPERVVEALMDIGRIVSIVKDEFEESLRKAVEQCKV